MTRNWLRVLEDISLRHINCKLQQHLKSETGWSGQLKYCRKQNVQCFQLFCTFIVALIGSLDIDL